MEEIGLASQMAGRPPDPMRNIQQIVMLLKQGITPEELIEGGIPQELVEKAIIVLQQKATQAPIQDEIGLAHQMSQQGMV